MNRLNEFVLLRGSNAAFGQDRDIPSFPFFLIEG